MIELILYVVILACVFGIYEKCSQLEKEYDNLKQKLTRTNQPRDSKGRFMKKGK